MLLASRWVVAGVTPPDIQIDLQYLAYNNSQSSFDASVPFGFPTWALPGPEQVSARGWATPNRFLTESGTQTLSLGSAGFGPAVFSMNANVDENGNVSGGTFSIVGDDPYTAPNTTVSLLSGTFTHLREALTNAGILEFDATMIGGAFASIFGPEVVIKIGSLGVGNTFLDDFFILSQGSLNVGKPVPEPTTFVAWGIGAASLLFRRRRRS